MEATGSGNSSSRWGVVAIVLAALVVGAGAGAWFVQRGMESRPTAESTARPSTPSPTPVAVPPLAEPRVIVVTLPADGMERLQLGFAEVTTGTARMEVRVPGAVAPDGYREVAVTSLVGGVATEVSAQLGQTVQRGQTLARLFSQDLADAQTALIGMNSELEVEHKKLMRVQELVGLGAASREELEVIEGAHQLHTAHIEQARQRLLLLGLTPAQVDQVSAGRQVSSDISIPAPIDGVVISRTVNLGQVVSTSQELFTITDLSSVWIEGSLLENDFARVRIGSRASITTTAYPDRIYQGAVDYIDPRVDPQTRTAKVRVIVGNDDLALRLGMYADLLFTSTSGGSAPVVPPEAVQRIGPNSVVYVPIDGESNRFEQRSVVMGAETPRGIQVLEGLRPGERVVTEGSFLVRAEALRQYPQ